MTPFLCQADATEVIQKRYCVNTATVDTVLTQRFTSILIFLYRLRLFAITPGSFRLCHPGPDEFVCFGLGPVADEQFRSQRLVMTRTRCGPRNLLKF